MAVTSSFGSTLYLGLGSTYHDPALALVDDHGRVLFAEALERPLQQKRALNQEADHPSVLPALLETYGHRFDRLVVASNWNARRPWYEHLAHRLGWLEPRGILRHQGRELAACLPTWQLHYMQSLQRHALAKQGVSLARLLRERFPGVAVAFRSYDHHLTHAALGAYASPFRDAACAVIDSYGEQGALAFFAFEDGKLRPLYRSRGPQSLGFFYMKLTELCGFDWLAGEEWKVMGLAAYGEQNDALLRLFEQLFKVDGFDLHQDRSRFFKVRRQLEAYRRPLGAPAEDAADLARTGQVFFTQSVNALLSGFRVQGLSENLVLAGGCALNSSTNGQLLRGTGFERLYIPSAPADDGTALGAALLAYHSEHPRAPGRERPLSPYLGSTPKTEEIERFARFSGLQAERLTDEALFVRAAQLLAEGGLLGWMRGRAEFGPRALGHRSILADPRDPEMMARINARVKFRERFRPYAPAILDEYGDAYFHDYQFSPYMAQTLRYRSEVLDRVPAVVHADGTGRVQSVSRHLHPDLHGLLSVFHDLTRIPLLLNTSFNVMGKPMVHSVEDAFAVFMGSGLDALIVGDRLFVKPRKAFTG